MQTKTEDERLQTSRKPPKRNNLHLRLYHDTEIQRCSKLQQNQVVPVQNPGREQVTTRLSERNPQQ